jgi:hypothetical protein
MKPILRATVVIAVTATAISLGVVGVHASTQCVRFVRQKIRHHKVSAATAARWKTWDQAHPDWHPKPTPKETWDKLAFACEVPVTPQQTAAILPPIQLSPLMLPAEMTTPCAPPVVVAMNQPPDFVPVQPAENLVTPPIYSPEYPSVSAIPIPETSGPPPPIGATPEPSTWVLMATALFSMAGIAWRRKRALPLGARA